MVKNINTSVQFDWTRLLFAIFVQNIGIWVDPEANIDPLFDYYSTPNSRLNSGSFLNSEAGSNSLPKFANMSIIFTFLTFTFNKLKNINFKVEISSYHGSYSVVCPY